MSTGLLPKNNRITRLAIPEGIDLERIERAVREILVAVGEDPDRDGLAETPRRVARSYAELFRGLRESAATHLHAEVFGLDQNRDGLGLEVLFDCIGDLIGQSLLHLRPAGKHIDGSRQL